jgi:deoxyribose-phosphate aldolase
VVGTRYLAVVSVCGIAGVLSKVIIEGGAAPDEESDRVSRLQKRRAPTTVKTSTDSAGWSDGRRRGRLRRVSDRISASSALAASATNGALKSSLRRRKPHGRALV